MMNDPFLSQGYIALSLIKVKDKIFNENFVTMSELNQFTIFMQGEFNKRELGIAIVHRLDREYFNVREGIITITEKCRDNLNMLKVSDILNDESLILNFLMTFENKRLERLQNFQIEDSKSAKNDNKVLSKLLSK